MEHDVFCCLVALEFKGNAALPSVFSQPYLISLGETNVESVRDSGLVVGWKVGGAIPPGGEAAGETEGSRFMGIAPVVENRSVPDSIVGGDVPYEGGDTVPGGSELAVALRCPSVDCRIC